jgi:hypothetical protein
VSDDRWTNRWTSSLEEVHTAVEHFVADPEKMYVLKESTIVHTFTPTLTGTDCGSFEVPAGTEFSYEALWARVPGADTVTEHRIRLADGREGFIGQAILPGSDWLNSKGGQ